MNRKVQKECESGCEYILPDYMGDIKKLLLSRAKVVPTGKFVGEGSVEVSGTVEYEVFYADSDGKLTAINTASDFTHNIVTDTEKYIDCAEESRISGLKVRVCGPRKIAVKAAVETALAISEEKNLEVDGSVFSGEYEGIEKCSKTINLSRSIFKKSGEREYAEIAEKIEKTDASEVEIVSAFASVHITDAAAADGEVIIKGENIVSAILETSERAPFSIKRSIPFEETVTVEGANKDMLVLADGVITSVSIGLGNDGEDCNAVANIIAEYNVEIIENVSQNVITDAYIPKKETVNKYRETEYAECVFCRMEEFDLEVKCKKEECGLGEINDILAVSAEVRPTGAVLSKSGCEFSGEIFVNAIACEANVDGSISYIPVKMQENFVKNVSFDLQIPNGTALDYALDVKLCEPYFDTESLNVKCVIGAKVYLFKPSNIKRLSSCELVDGEPLGEDSSVINVYYPKYGECLFDIAKKYHTTSAKIASDNNLSENVASIMDSSDSLSGVKKLIIR